MCARVILTCAYVGVFSSFVSDYVCSVYFLMFKIDMNYVTGSLGYSKHGITA